VSEDLDKLEYAQTTDLLRTLTDVRFKLLAFTPTIAGAAVALLSRGPHATSLLAVGALGFAATVGVLFYELHNTQVYEYALAHAEQLEARLGLGLFTSRPHYAHDRPLAIVYAVVLGAWGYLVAWGAFAAGGVAHPQVFGGLVGAAVASAAGLRLAGAPWREKGPAVTGPSAVTSSGS
jgi:hypothetical protein